VGATSQPLGFPAPLARRARKFSAISFQFLAFGLKKSVLRFSFTATKNLELTTKDFEKRRASGTGHAHRLSIRSTPEIRYGSNGFRALTCVEVPLRAQL
jgi:hypothetical protein